MEPDTTLPSYKRNKELNEIVRNLYGDPGLNDYMDVNLVEAYARTFNQDANRVYQEIDFETIIMFAVKWKREHEHRERKDIIERMMAGDLNQRSK